MAKDPVGTYGFIIVVYCSGMIRRFFSHPSFLKEIFSGKLWIGWSKLCRKYYANRGQFLRSMINLTCCSVYVNVINNLSFFFLILVSRVIVIQMKTLLSKTLLLDSDVMKRWLLIQSVCCRLFLVFQILFLWYHMLLIRQIFLFCDL